MLRAVVAGDQIRVLELIAAFASGILETDGEGRQLFHADLAQQPDQQARVDAAGQQHADIHRCPLANRHGLAGAGEYPVAPVLQAQVEFVGLRTVVQRPPGLLFALAIGVDAQPGCRWQFLDAGQQGTRCWHHGMEVQVVIERDRIQQRADIAALQQRRQARSEAQALVGTRQVQRLA